MVDCGKQIAGAADLCDAEGGPGPDGLDKERIPQSGGLGGDGGPVIALGQRDGPGGWDPSSSDEPVGAVFVHTEGRCQHAAACHRDTRQSAQPLDSAVLTVLPVQNGQDGVQPDAPQPCRVKNQQRMVAAVRADARWGAGALPPSVA